MGYAWIHNVIVRIKERRLVTISATVSGKGITLALSNLEALVHVRCPVSHPIAKFQAFMDTDT